MVGLGDMAKNNGGLWEAESLSLALMLVFTEHVPSYFNIFSFLYRWSLFLQVMREVTKCFPITTCTILSLYRLGCSTTFHLELIKSELWVLEGRGLRFSQWTSNGSCSWSGVFLPSRKLVISLVPDKCAREGKLYETVTNQHVERKPVGCDGSLKGKRRKYLHDVMKVKFWYRKPRSWHFSQHNNLWPTNQISLDVSSYLCLWCCLSQMLLSFIHCLL